LLSLEVERDNIIAIDKIEGPIAISWFKGIPFNKPVRLNIDRAHALLLTVQFDNEMAFAFIEWCKCDVHSFISGENYWVAIRAWKFIGYLCELLCFWAESHDAAFVFGSDVNVFVQINRSHP
jgi:hypothetical protein